MSLINWIFDVYQHHKLSQTRNETEELRSELASLRSGSGGMDADRLERAVGELALAVRTLQRVILEKGVVTGTELRQKLDEVDREDGRADGRAPL